MGGYVQAWTRDHIWFVPARNIIDTPLSRKINNKNKNYYSYDLSRNCFAFEHKGKTPSYNVYTDDNGYRTGKAKNKTKDKKILFLGDSFTYGFGVDYEYSIPGQLSKKLDTAPVTRDYIYN